MPDQEPFGAPPVAPGEPHLACVLLLDTSGSMGGIPIDNLNKALVEFKDKLSMDEMAQKRVEIAIVEFNSNASVVQDFVPLINMQPVTLTARGTTAMGAGVNMAIDMAKGRTRYYHQLGTPVYKPWIFMITDGAPIDSIEEAARKIQEEERKGTHGKLKFFALGVGEYDKDTLFRFFEGVDKRQKRVMELTDMDFSTIFDWMSESMSAISVSRVGEDVKVAKLPGNAHVVKEDTDDW